MQSMDSYVLGSKAQQALQPDECLATPRALGDNEYLNPLSWNPVVIGYRVRIILHPCETHE